MSAAQERLRKAIEEAYASCPNTVEHLYTLEINHATFETPARVARWSSASPEPKKFMCKLEDNAPYNPGETVEFIGLPFEITLPESSEQMPGTMNLKVSGVGYALDADLEGAALSGGKITAIFRVFTLGEENEGPTMTPYSFDIQEPSLDPTTGDIQATGVIFGFFNKPYGKLYIPGDYPALTN